MNLEKYKSLREQIRDKSFEKKFFLLNKILYIGSILGNIASIFFAFFLWFPSLLKTITLHIADNGFTYALAVGCTIVLLSMIELIKRGTINIFSSDFIEANYRLNTNSLFAQLFFAFSLVALSFYFSVNGAVEFSKTSGKKNVSIETESKNLVDSLSRMNEESKAPIIAELSSLRESNKQLRDKRDNTPINFRAVRNEYNQLIFDNEKLIDENNKKLIDLDNQLKSKISDLRKEEVIQKTKNTDEDRSNIVLFFIVSSVIEIFIVIGVYFRQLYVHNSFYEHEGKFEAFFQKKEKYDHLLKIVYKNGDVNQDDIVLSLSKLTEIMKSKSAHYSPKIIKEFYTEMSHLGAFKIVGNKRYAVVSYDDAKKLLNSLETV